MTSNPLQNILIIGAGGTNIGHHLALALSSDPSFTLTILSRANSKSTHPPNATILALPSHPTHADYVQAFRGQDAVVSCLGYEGKKSEKALIDAAVQAGVKRFLPSEYGVDNTNSKARELSPVFDMKGEVIEYLREKEGEGLEWTAVPTGMWLEWALDPSHPFIGIDIRAHTAEIWSREPYKFSFTTLSTAADAIRLILSHPASTRNRVVPVQNFSLSQADIVAVLEHVQGVKYRISYLKRPEEVIQGFKRRWEVVGETDVEARLGLAKAGFLMPGFGSNFEEGSWEMANRGIGFGAGSVAVEDVVREAVRRYGA
ncbi:hypothetical protein Q7P37_010432 [Cladosporium fusiforme]